MSNKRYLLPEKTKSTNYIYASKKQKEKSRKLDANSLHILKEGTKGRKMKTKRSMKRKQISWMRTQQVKYKKKAQNMNKKP